MPLPSVSLGCQIGAQQRHLQQQQLLLLQVQQRHSLVAGLIKHKSPAVAAAAVAAAAVAAAAQGRGGSREGCSG